MLRLLVSFLTLATVLGQSTLITTSHTTTAGAGTRTTSRTGTASTVSGNASTVSTTTGLVTASVLYTISGTVTVPLTSTVLASSPATSTVTAQFPSLSGVSDCVTQCLQSAVSQVNCTTIIDTSCYCGQQAFANATASCAATTCPDQVDATENLAKQFCNVASASLSFPPTPSSSTISSGSVSPTSSRSTGFTLGIRDASGTAFLGAVVMVGVVAGGYVVWL